MHIRLHIARIHSQLANNAGWGMGLFEVENADSEFMDLLVEDEQEYADEMSEKYKYLRDD
jgi:hypothetical protein